MSNVRTCDDGTIFEPYTRSCLPGNRETCEFDENPITPPPPTNTPPTNTPPTNTPPTPSTQEPTTTVTVTEPPPTLEELCQAVTGVGVVAFPNSCVTYVLCVFGEPDVRTCPSNEVFLAVNGRCLPGDPDTCTVL